MQHLFMTLFLSCSLFMAIQAQTQEYFLKNYNERDELTVTSDVTITEKGDVKYYRIRDDDGGDFFVTVHNEIFQDSVIYKGQPPSKDFKVDIDFHSRIISKYAKKITKKPFQGFVLASNASVFFIFSHLYDFKTTQKMVFGLFLTDSNNLVRMRLKNQGVVSLNVKGEKIRAYDLVMELEDAFPRLFWPYKYHYYYKTGTLDFVRYEGKNGKRRDEYLIAEKITPSKERGK